MERTTTTAIRIGAWRVEPESGHISRDGETIRLELRTIRLLLCLADRAGQVVSVDDLLSHVWNGVTVTSDSVYQAVTTLRRTLGDDPKQPTYIATVPRRGYRMVATVTTWEDQIPSIPDVQSVKGTTLSSLKNQTGRFAAHGRIRFWLAGFAALCFVFGIAARLFLSHDRSSTIHRAGPVAMVPSSEKTVAVLPFLDLTQGMKQGEFTDGMTEELIDKLSKVPGLRVPPPTSSFYYRDRQVSVSEIATKLGVAYILDGSVRKSGARLRVAARLVRADTGYVIWSETYDRPWHYTILLQNDIAGELADAVKASLEHPDSFGK